MIDVAYWQRIGYTPPEGDLPFGPGPSPTSFALCQSPRSLLVSVFQVPRWVLPLSMEKYASFGSPNAVISRHGRSQNISIRGRRK